MVVMAVAAVGMAVSVIVGVPMIVGMIVPGVRVVVRHAPIVPFAALQSSPVFVFRH